MKKVEDIQPAKTEEKQPTNTAQSFMVEYQALCKKTGFQIVVNPAFKARDDGTYSVVLQASVGKLPNNT